MVEGAFKRFRHEHHFLKGENETETIVVEGESIEMFSTISFNSDNLIHIYAGQDGVPCTGDDRFVFAPRYWERATVRLEVR